MQKHPVSSPDVLGWPWPLLKLCHFAVFFHTFEWQGQQLFNLSSDTSSSDLCLSTLAAEAIFLCTHTLQAKSLVEQLHCSATDTISSGDKINLSILFTLTFFLAHAMQCNAMCPLAHGNPHPGDSSTCFPSDSRCPSGATPPSGNQDFGRLLLLCPGLMCKLVPSCASTAKAQ